MVTHDGQGMKYLMADAIDLADVSKLDTKRYQSPDELYVVYEPL